MKELVDWFRNQPTVTQLLYMNESGTSLRFRYANVSTLTEKTGKQLTAWFRQNLPKIKFEDDPTQDVTPWLIRQSFEVAKKTRRARTNQAVKVSDGVVAFYHGDRPQDSPVGRIDEDRFVLAAGGQTNAADYFLYFVGDPDKIMKAIEAAYLIKED